jgi:hypothetical protein
MKQQPLLMDELTDVQRVSLVSLIQHPGWKVVELFHTSACQRATEAVIKVDPEEANSEKIISVRQFKARERNEFSGLILGSVQYHIDVVAQGQKEETEKAPTNPILGNNKQ